MDETTFATLSRRVGQAPSRRAALAALVTGAGAVLLGRGPAVAQVEPEVFGFCKMPGKKCSKNAQCCAGTCKKRACGCRKNGKPAAVGIICCSGNVRRGKCRKK